MEKEFVPYELALRMNQLGFDEPCLANWNFYIDQLIYNGNPSTFSSEDVLQLPLFQQAFRWFREKGYLSYIEVLGDGKYDYTNVSSHFSEETDYNDGPFESYEEAEIACLQKLIEIVEQSKSE